MKQHLYRTHYRAFYCPVCYDVFSEEQPRNEHAQRRLCAPRPEVEFDWISQGQREQLSRKSDPRLAEDQQWFSIFELLFPGHPHPRSAYVDNELSEDFNAFWDWTHVRGPEIFNECARSSGDTAITSLSHNAEMQPTLESLFRTAMNALFTRWSS